MAMFLNWLTFRDTATLLRLRLLEHAEFFRPADYNAVFAAELEKLIRRLPDGEAKQQAMAMKGFDWGGYISRSLLRAGFRDDDQQEHFHSIVVRLLVEPGKLFRGWQPEKHGGILERFKRSTWNAIRNIVQKDKNRRRRMTDHDPAAMADRFAGRQPHNNIISEFRRLVAERLGKLAAAVFDQRLAGLETKDLVGRTDLGEPSSYRIKQMVAEIKRLGVRFAAQVGDPSFVRMVNQAFDAEAITVAKRQAARQAATA
jgi:hypothetical protein